MATDHDANRIGWRMKFGIQQKVLAVLGGVLVLNTLLGSLLASYYTNRQNQEAAFAALANDLVAWQTDLTTAVTQLKTISLATVGDTVVLTQLADLVSLERVVADFVKPDDRPQLLATLGYRKTASLNRLDLALRTGRFDSIAVHTQGRLSHFVSNSEVGMSVRSPSGQEIWVSAPVNARGEFPLSTWPAWPESQAPVVETAYNAKPVSPEMNIVFEPGQEATLRIVVPVHGIADTVMTDLSPPLTPRVYAEPGIAGLSRFQPPAASASELEKLKREVFAVVVFRKAIGRSVLEDFAKHSGKVPALFSPDGLHRQILASAEAFSPALVRQAASGTTPSSESAQQPTVAAGRQPFYAALQPWQFDGQTRLILGLATPQDLTTQNIRQTVFAILAASAAVLLLSIAVGQWWVRRYMNPIVQLTASVRAVAGPASQPRDGVATVPSLPTTLRPTDLAAPDEVGELARAFNAMVAELQRSFSTLEQQVQSRTAELRQQERYLRTLIDLLPMRAWFKDAQSRYLVVNQVLARDCDLSVSEMTGKLDSELLAAPLAAEQLASDLQIMTARLGGSSERHEPERGAGAWRETYLAPVIDEDGSVLGIVGVSRDISDRKAVETAREVALIEARRLAVQRSGFLAHMSHELRTPLNGILGFAQVLRQETNLSELQVRGLRIIEDSGNHLLELITDILDLASIDAGRLELRPEDADLPALVKTVCDLVRVKADEKRLRFDLEIDNRLPSQVRLDKQRLRQVLLNLLSNAIKFTDAGSVTLRVHRLQAGAETGSVASVPLRFEVEDSGVGLTPPQIERLFQPFEQFGEHKRRAGGSGLGLAITQQLVRLMGGEINVYSRPGIGSRFTFEVETLIARQSPIVPSSSPAVPIGYAGPRRRVLVVDDVEQNRAVIIQMLQNLGFETAEAQDGRQALGVAVRWRPDVVVMDLMMPVMNGFDAIRRLREQGSIAHVPIIAASASATLQAEREAREAGADAFIVKPIQQSLLIDALGDALRLTWLR